MFGRKASRGWTTSWPDEATDEFTAITTAVGGVVAVVAAGAAAETLSSMVGRCPSRQGWQGQGLIPVELSTRRCSRQKRLWQLGHSTQSRRRRWHASQLNGPLFVVSVCFDVASLLHVLVATAEEEKRSGWARADLAPPFSMRASDRLSVLQPLGGGEDPRGGVVAPARGLEGGLESMSETMS